MKAHLMYADQDFDFARPLPPHEAELVHDLDLSTLFEAMARQDTYLLDVAKRAVLSSLNDPAAIAYRQRVLADCIAHPDVIREMYEIAVAALEGERRIWPSMRQHPSTILRRAVEALELFAGLLRKLRQIADQHQADFASEGLTAFFAMLQRDLDDAYFQTIEGHLKRLKFRNGILISAELGRANKGVRYVLRTPGTRGVRWTRRVGIGRRTSYSFEIAPRDDAGARALGDLTDRGLNPVANALAQSTDHISSFFTLLRRELGFYVGCLNLHERLLESGEPVCTPVPLPMNPPTLSCRGLYDACLALRTEGRVVGNDVAAGGTSLVMITGANSGGKSTFLRSVGVAHLMMQCGLFVAAESFRASVCDGLFTHFSREEDAAMRSGRLDEELGRMSAIAADVTPGSIVLFNESFAATNEREGSEIARQVVRALLESEIRVFFVTHLFDLASGLYERRMPTALFLRAERQTDERTRFKLVEGRPLPTSYGDDVYHRIGGWTIAAEAAEQVTEA